MICRRLEAFAGLSIESLDALALKQRLDVLASEPSLPR